MERKNPHSADDPHRASAEAGDAARPVDRSTPRGDEPASEPIAVTVARTGGIAGIRREWEAVAPPADPSLLVNLVRACPWDAPETPSRGADRFVWHIRVVATAHEHDRRLAETDLTGPWLALVDAVRADHSASDRQPDDTDPPSPSTTDQPGDDAPHRTDSTTIESSGRTTARTPDEGN